jgi:hypothetical protein
VARFFLTQEPIAGFVHPFQPQNSLNSLNGGIAGILTVKLYHSGQGFLCWNFLTQFSFFQTGFAGTPAGALIPPKSSSFAGETPGV